MQSKYIADIESAFSLWKKVISNKKRRNSRENLVILDYSWNICSFKMIIHKHNIFLLYFITMVNYIDAFEWLKKGASLITWSHAPSHPASWLGLILWRIWAPRKVLAHKLFPASHWLTFATAPFPKQIFSDNSESKAESFQGHQGKDEKRLWPSLQSTTCLAL